MQYELNVEEVSQIRRSVSFTVPQGVVNAELDKAYREISRTANLPGFRRGKVPRRILEARFGGKITEDVATDLIQQSWRQASADFDLAGQAQVEDRGDLKRGVEFTFTLGVDVVPTVEAVGYKGIDVPFKATTVSDEEVEAELSARLAGQARFGEVTDRPVQAGDQVLAKVNFVDGEDVILDEPGTLITVGAERFYSGIDGLLEGLSIGEDNTGEATIGAQSLREDLRGRSGTATVTVQAIQARVVPELDDKVAKALGFEGGADGVRPALRMEMDARGLESARMDARVKILEKLVASHDFDVPDALVQEQFEALVEEMKVRRTYAGADPRSVQFSQAELQNLRSRGRFAAKASVLLAAVARQEDIKVESADVDAKINEIASMRNQTAAAIRGYLQNEGAMPTLELRILEEKVLEWVLENANLTEPEVVVESEEVADEAAEAAGSEE